MSNDKIINNFTIINNNTNPNSTTINNNSNSIFFINDRNSIYFFLSIVSVLFIILIIAILILIFLLKRNKKNTTVQNISNNNPNIIINKKEGFQKVQNTSKVNDLVQPNNVLNEIKTFNLGEEIHKIVHSSINSSFTTFGGGKRSNKKATDQNLNTSGNSFGKGDFTFGNKNIVLNKELKKEENSDVNTQKLEQELKQQIKKYVIEDNNI